MHLDASKVLQAVLHTDQFKIYFYKIKDNTKIKNMYLEVNEKITSFNL